MKKRSFLSTLLALAAVSAIIALMLLGLPSVITVFGAGASNSVGGNVIVPTVCAPSPSNTLITFPNTNAGSFASTANAENVIIYGTTTSNIWVSGGAWTNTVTGSLAFNVGNTLWNPTTGGNIGTQLTGAAVDTKVAIFTNGAGFGNVVFFGTNVPTGVSSGADNQILTISSAC